MNLLWPFLLSLGFCLVLTPIVAVFARKYGLVDDPKKHRHPAILHAKIIPRAGGLAIFASFLITSLILLPITKQILGIILGGLILVVVGTLDDRFDLSRSWKLVGQIVAAVTVIGLGVGISFITNPLSLLGASEVMRLDTLRITFDFWGRHSIVVWADLFALFWIVWVVNMVNFSSGVDGQMPGIVLVTLIVLFAAALRLIVDDPSQIIVSKLALIGAGTTLGFLIYNFFPAKIFPGDSGSYFLGFLIAVLAILSGAKVGTAILVMAIPLIDGVYTVIRRVVSGRSPFLGDRKHLHHRLLEMGWGQRRIALFYWLVCAILGATALSFSATEKLFAVVVVTVVILGGLLWLDMNLPIRAQK